MDSEARFTPKNVLLTRGSKSSCTSSVSRRFTPYTKTPETRRLHKTRSRRKAPADDQDLKRYTNKTWNVYQVTPLFNFKRDLRSLKRYSRHMSAFLRSESHKGEGFYQHEEEFGKAVFGHCKGLSSKNDLPAVELNVTSTNGKDGKVQKVAFTGILCSVGGSDVDIDIDIAKQFVCLPLLLVKGLAGVTKSTMKWFEQQFDCRVRKFHFSSSHLSWMVAMWAGLDGGAAGKPLELMYTTPSDIKGINSIILNIDQDDAKELWKCVHDENSDEFTVNEVEDFNRILEAHFFHHFKIHISSLALKRIGTSLAFVGSEGKLKILSAASVLTVLRHLTELAMENTIL